MIVHFKICFGRYRAVAILLIFICVSIYINVILMLYYRSSKSGHIKRHCQSYGTNILNGLKKTIVLLEIFSV